VDNIKLPFAEQVKYVHITDTTCLGSTYQNGNINVNTATLEPGTYYYTDSVSADSIRYVMLTVATTPDVQISGNTSINYGQSTKLTATGAMTYQWNIGERAAVVNVTPRHTTTYTVVGYAKGCSADTATITIEVKNSGIGQAENDNSIQLYPNPATSHVAVSADEPMTYIVIYNSLGQALETINTQGQSMLQLNTARLSGGLYIIGIHTESNKWIRKHLIISR
jgi:hypothetical protein